MLDERSKGRSARTRVFQPFSLLNLKNEIYQGNQFATPDGGLIAASSLGYLQARDDRGSYTVPGLEARKQAVTSAGGTTLDLAIAMLETDDMNTDYNSGDGKTEDSANFGVFKQNRFALRTSASAFEGETTAQWNDGAVLKPPGWTGWNQDPNTGDINTYKSAVEWMQEQIESNSIYLTDDTRFWVNVTVI